MRWTGLDHICHAHCDHVSRYVTLSMSALHTPRCGDAQRGSMHDHHTSAVDGAIRCPGPWTSGQQSNAYMSMQYTHAAYILRCV